MLLEVTGPTMMTRECVGIMILKFKSKQAEVLKALKEKFSATSPNVR